MLLTHKENLKESVDISSKHSSPTFFKNSSQDISGSSTEITAKYREYSVAYREQDNKRYLPEIYDKEATGSRKILMLLPLLALRKGDEHLVEKKSTLLYMTYAPKACRNKNHRYRCLKEVYVRNMLVKPNVNGKIKAFLDKSKSACILF